DAEDDLAAGSGSVGRFRERKAVRIVGDAHLALERGAQILVEGMADQPCRVALLHQARRRADRAGNGDADRAARDQLAFAAEHEIAHGSDHVAVVFLRRGDAPAHELLATLPKRDDLSLRAAEVDSDAHQYPALVS